MARELVEQSIQSKAARANDGGKRKWDDNRRGNQGNNNFNRKINNQTPSNKRHEPTKDSGFELTGFSDADYVGCKDTFKSTSGGAQFLGEKMGTCPILQNMKKLTEDMLLLEGTPKEGKSHEKLPLKLVKENPKKDKIGSKPDKNGKRGEAEKSQKQLQWIEQEKLKKHKKKGQKNYNPKGERFLIASRFPIPPLASTMTDNHTMAEMLRAPTEGCAEAIIVPSILAEQFELKHSLINMMTSEQFFGLEKDNPHDHGQPAGGLKKNPRQKFDESFHEAWERYKDLLRACPHHGFTELPQLDTFYNALNPANQDSLNAAAGGNLLEKSPQDALTIIENKSKVRNSQSKPIASPVSTCDNHYSSELAKLTHVVNQQTSAVTTAMMAMLKQFQSNPPPAQVKAVKEICVTCGSAHSYYQCLAAGGNTFPEYRDNIQGYVSVATGNYNQGNPGYRPQGVANQMRPPGFAQPNVQNNQNRFGQPQGFNRGPNFNQEQHYQATQSNQNFHLNELEKIKRMNDVSLKAMQNQIDMMNTASTSGSGTLPGNTIANPKGELKAITTRSGLVTDGPTVPNPPKSINPEEDGCVEKTYTDPDHAEYTIKVPPPPPVQKPKPPIQIIFFCLLWTLFHRISRIPAEC
nr:hypothetical protein [Tanacetum cinerariifolium]